MRGTVYIAFGQNALREAAESARTFKEFNKRIPVKILKKPLKGGPLGLTQDQEAHWAKVTVNNWSPFEPTLLLDADTRIKGDLSFGFKVMRNGWDLAIAPSIPPSNARNPALWSLKRVEMDQTFQELGTWQHAMFNTGVMFFRKTPRMARLFDEWRKEWLRFKDRDQGALLRALRRCPVSMWLLGRSFNSAAGEIVEHRFGAAR